jgi:hypothetical protein
MMADLRFAELAHNPDFVRKVIEALKGDLEWIHEILDQVEMEIPLRFQLRRPDEPSYP